METSLHRELKTRYAGVEAQVEVRLGDYRVDARQGDLLVEIQHGSLAAIRDKIRALLAEHRVLVVKPLVAEKTLVSLAERDGEELRRRRSPKRASWLDLFEELVHFTRVFPHRRLTLEVPLIEVEETRYPGHGRRRRWRRTDYVIADQRLLAVKETRQFRTAGDLVRLLPAGLVQPFDTGELAAALGVSRPRAQRIAYCLQHAGATRLCGKRGNARLYAFRRRGQAA